MPDVFISYSRRDKEFVQRLHQSLAALKSDVWVDWEDIPLTADWWKEICTGIESADTFVCILSPDFVQSEVCNKEVEHAFANKKRFIPVLYRELSEAQPTHPAISTHNWIFIRPTDDYETAFKALVSALETDLAYVRAHTRLLVRAIEWDTKNRDDSLLLRGGDLSEAEAWLTTSRDKQPEPAPMHIEYITVSRRAESRRQRTLLAGVSVALIVSIGLALLSFLLYRQSEENREAAENNAAISEANALLAENERATAVSLRLTAEYSSDVSLSAALAARSQLELERSPEFAVLLALDALENSVYTTQAETALGLAVQNMRPRLLVQPRDDGFISDAWSPDGTRFAAGDLDGNVFVWDALSGNELLRWTEESLVRGVEWSPDGKQMVTVTDAGFAMVRDAQTGDEQLKLDGNFGTANNVKWSPDGTRVLTGGSTGGIVIWDVETGEQVAHGPGKEAIWSPDGQSIASVERNSDSLSVVMVWDAETGKERLTFESDTVFETYGLDWSPDGTRIVTGGMDDTGYVWDADTGKELYRLVGHSDDIFDVDWSPDGQYIVTGSGSESGFDETVRIWDANSGSQLTILPGAQRYPRWSPDSSFILTVDDDFGVSAWSAQVGIELRTFYGQANSVRGVNDVDWSPDSQWVVTAGSDGTAQVWNPRTGEIRLMLHHRNSVSTANWSPDGRWILTGSFDNTVRVWDAETGEEKIRLDDFDDWVDYSDWSPDGTRILTVSRTIPSLQVWEVEPENGKAHNLEIFVPSEDALSASTYPMAIWSPDGTQLLVSGGNAQFVFSATTGEQLFLLPSAGRGVAWSADGRYALTATFQSFGSPETGDNNAVLIWDLSMPSNAMRSLVGHTNTVRRADWSPNGTRILSASTDNTAKVWDAATGDELLTLHGHDMFVWDAAWSPDGTMIVTVSEDGTAKVWPAWQTPQDLIDYAYQCCVSRGFTPQETGQLNRMRYPVND